MARKKKKKKPAAKKQKGSAKAKSAPRLSRVGVGELRAALAAGQVPLLVDVRTGMEFNSGHVEGSVNVPLATLEGRLGELTGEPVWLICRTGNRSAQAALILERRGRTVVDVAGGTVAWTREGYDLVGQSFGQRAISSLGPPLLASLLLGLAPFGAEPHILGKIRWVMGGAVGMGAMDWGDLVMHGAPWVWLLVALVRLVAKR